MAKKKKSNKKSLLITAIIFSALVVVWIATPGDTAFKQVNTWQRMTSPGPLSAAHASLEGNCAACHTPVAGAEAANCIVCHANDKSLLQDQATSFHANVASCKECHLEHQGRDQRTLEMDHVALAELGLRQLKSNDPNSESERVRQSFAVLMKHMPESALPHPRIVREELVLNCTTCHENDDPHVGYFGDNCATCHATNRWSIPEYIHPPADSVDCAQCHKAPPSHYMPMFMSMCAKMLGKSPKSVSQCYVCHMISGWNDMKDAPWHKKSMSHIPSR